MSTSQIFAKAQLVEYGNAEQKYYRNSHISLNKLCQTTLTDKKQKFLKEILSRY